VWGSGKEVVFTLIVSNATLLVAVFIHFVDTQNAKIGLDEATTVIFSNIKATEILAYVLAIIAAPLWIMVSRWRARRHANFFFWLLFLQFVMVSGSAYIFAKARGTGVANQEFASSWAFYCFASSVVLWFITLTYEKLVLDAADETMASPSSSGESGEGVLGELRGRP
jgi:uncharacterized membrane protein YhaH (DUF805 family)